MVTLTRHPQNPILKPEPQNSWEALAAFNPSVAKEKDKYHLVYRAQSPPVSHFGASLNLSSIGHAVSLDGVNFTDRKQFIAPKEDWELFGCEDPRVTEFEGKYFIFYTSLSAYPFTPYGIKVGVALTRDFQKIEAKHQVTHFNSKAMVLFPQRVNAKIAAVLTVNTDIPPAKIALALFDKEEDIWSPDFWEDWYGSLDAHVIPFLRSLNDQVEVGAAPLKTEGGWLLIYAYIKDYFSPSRIFGIEAVLLDQANPQKIIGKTTEPLLLPQEEYERNGNIPNVIFPSGALVNDDKLFVYYGAGDTTCCLATCRLNDLLKVIKPPKSVFFPAEGGGELFIRFEGNPIISPIPELSWEARATFNPGAIYEEGRIHLLYRAMSQDNTSVLGYGVTSDGFTIEKRLPYPIYEPREEFEKKLKPFANSGCEDPRLTKIGDKIYMCYTAFDGQNPPRVALTSIDVHEFLNHHWVWEKPKLISPPGVDDKDAFILPKKIDGRYIIFHRIGSSIWIEKVNDLNFGKDHWLGGEILISPRKDKWDNLKVGATAPAIETKDGWLLLYHGVSGPEMIYKVGALLLDLNNPQKIISRTDKPIFEPQRQYEKEGNVPNVVFPCGTVVFGDKLLIYYGGGDRVIGVAQANLNKLLTFLQSETLRG